MRYSLNFSLADGVSRLRTARLEHQGGWVINEVALSAHYTAERAVRLTCRFHGYELGFELPAGNNVSRSTLSPTFGDYSYDDAFEGEWWIEADNQILINTAQIQILSRAD
jgi:hypothetical protein